MEPKLKDWTNENNEFYGSFVEARGEGWQAFWGTKESQTVRFDVFHKYLPLEGASVIDVGCGFGQFLDYSNSKGIHLSRYLGLDTHERMVNGAKQHFPEGEFAQLNILEEEPPFRPDFIVSSGITAVKFDGFEEYVKLVFQRFNEIADKGFAINFLSTQSKKPDPRSQYTEPGWALQLFHQVVDWRCVLVHDYKPNDFTIVYLKK